MGIPSEVASKAKTSSGEAAGSGMAKKTPIVGNSSPKTNSHDPVTRNQGWSQSKLGLKRVSSGY